jgi:hypothetical protein
MKQFLFVIPILIFCFLGRIQLQAQIASVSGTISDSKSGEQLIGAVISVKELSGVGVAANGYGYYSLILKPGKYTLMATFLGYETFSKPIELNSDIKLDISLDPKSRELKTIEIQGERPDENLSRVQMGVEKFTPQEIKQIPVLFGEQDILKTLQLLPGVKGAGEGNAGFYVRGGSADQNLILLDEAPVYNASHLLGFFSVFNSDAIKDVTLYKGSMPAEFGGRISSVLDVKMNDGNQKRFNAKGGIGLISSRLTLEAPVVKDKSSFIISGRRTYADMFLKLSRDSTLNKSRLYFYDLNAKFNYKFNDKNRLFVSGYFGRDNFGFSDLFKFDWGNATGTARWNHLFSNRLFSNTSAIISNYDYQISLNAGGQEINISSTIRDINLKQDYQYFLDNNHTVKFGWNSIYHTFIPGKISGNGIFANAVSNEKRYAWENSIYGSDEWRVNSLLTIGYGLRLTEFSYLGPGTIYTYNSEGEVLTEYKAKNQEIVKSYLNAEPRINANYRLDEFQSVKAGYARTVQNMHLLSNTTSGNPTDIWVPSSNNVKPELGDQYSLGYFRNIKKNTYELSAETYYKSLFNQIDYRNGANLAFNQQVEGELVYGTGRAYGIELLARKKIGKLTGWIGYTLSRTERKFDGINNGNYYPARQDRTHDISIVAMYALSPKLAVSANWVYYTGNAVTFPSGKYEIEGQTVNYYSERNGYRMPAYHRLDLGLTWYRKNTETYESNWNFSIYNAYARRNAYTINFRDSETNPGTTEAVKLSLFRLVPSITYNFHFK